MSDPLIVIVFVAAGGAADATTRAMERATHDALGLEAHVDVHETEIVPSDLDVLVAEQKAHAAAVVELTWAEQGRQARLRVHVAKSGRWISRTIGFVPSDADAERGRTIGFAVASMLPEASPQEPSPQPSAPPGPAAPEARSGALPADSGPPPAAGSLGTPLAPLAVTTPMGEGVPASPSATARLPPEGSVRQRKATGVERLDERERRFALDVSGFGTYGLDANAQSVGGQAAAHWFFASVASLRLGAAVDGGSVDAARGNALTALVSGGIAFHPWRPTPSRPFGLSLRSEYLLANQSMTNFPFRDSSTVTPSTVTRSRWISGIDLAVDVRWLLTSSVDLVVGAGLQDFFGRTYIDRWGARAATLPAVRSFSEVGLAVRF